VREAGVMAVPSTVFEWGDAHLRLGLGRKGFAPALEALEDWLHRAVRGGSTAGRRGDGVP